MRASSLSWRRFYPFRLFVQNLVDPGTQESPRQAIFALFLHLPGQQHLIGARVMTQQATRFRSHGLRQRLVTGQVDQKLSGLNDCAGALTRHRHSILLAPISSS
ncbi:hypothetical protein OF001_U450002 [Pseudomonas sp. OF001]|nr:hypothetical protein OF001_U450002 [Pseudomonas sp. OF001]